MSDQPSETQPEPRSTTSEKPPIRKAQEEFIGDEAQPSKDRSEVDAADLIDPKSGQ